MCNVERGEGATWVLQELALPDELDLTLAAREILTGGSEKKETL